MNDLVKHLRQKPPVYETCLKAADELERLLGVVVEDVDYRTKASLEIDRLNHQYVMGLDAWKENNAYHVAEIARLQGVLIYVKNYIENDPFYTSLHQDVIKALRGDVNP